MKSQQLTNERRNELIIQTLLSKFAFFLFSLQTVYSHSKHVIINLFFKKNSLQLFAAAKTDSAGQCTQSWTVVGFCCGVL